MVKCFLKRVQVDVVTTRIPATTGLTKLVCQQVGAGV